MINYGQVAYEGYCLSSGNKSLVSGAELPTWDKLDPKIQAAWTAAGMAVGDAWAKEVYLSDKRVAEVREAARRGFEGIQHKD